MSQTDYVDLIEGKSPGDRTLMHVLYGLHTAAWASMGTLALVAAIINYVKSTDELDALYLSHHRYLLRSFCWTLLWLALAAPLWFLLFFPGAIAYGLIGLWYLYRCIRGWLHFADNRLP